jgi:hypothetical protein
VSQSIKELNKSEDTNSKKGKKVCLFFELRSKNYNGYAGKCRLIAPISKRENIKSKLKTVWMKQGKFCTKFELKTTKIASEDNLWIKVNFQKI